MYRLDPDVDALLIQLDRDMKRLLGRKPFVGPIPSSIEELKLAFTKNLTLLLERKSNIRFRELTPQAPLTLNQQEKKVAELIKSIQAELSFLPEPINYMVIREEFLPGLEFNSGIWIGEGALIEPEVILLSPVVIGKNCFVSSEAVLGCACLSNASVGEVSPQKDKYKVIVEGRGTILKAILGF